MPKAENTSAGKPKVGGAIYRAPVGTILPTDAVSELNEAFVDLGYCSEDGVTNSNSPESTTQKAWGGDTVLNAQTARPDKFKFKLLEALNPEVLKTAYGDEKVTGTIEEGIKVSVGSEDTGLHAYVIDMVLKNAVKRIVVPRATLTSLADIGYKDNDSIGYEVEISAESDATGHSHYEYIKSTT